VVNGWRLLLVKAGRRLTFDGLWRETTTSIDRISRNTRHHRVPRRIGTRIL